MWINSPGMLGTRAPPGPKPLSSQLARPPEHQGQGARLPTPSTVLTTGDQSTTSSCRRRRSHCPHRRHDSTPPLGDKCRPFSQQALSDQECEANRRKPASIGRDKETCAMVNPLATLSQTKLRIDKVENVSVPPN